MSVDRPGPMVEVEWIDSGGREGWHDLQFALDSLDRFGCISVGYLIADDERGVVIAQGTGELGTILSSMAIPRACVVAVHRLRR